MTRTTLALGASFLLASACSQNHRPPLPDEDCSIEDDYEFQNISNFSGDQSGWFLYSDPTPGGAPNPTINPDTGEEEGNVPVTDDPEHARCGDSRFMKLEMHGKNFWGAGFGDWAHNPSGSRVDGTGYEGISFWARSPINFEKEFIFNVDDPRTMINPPPAPEGGGLPPKVTEPDDGHLDLDGDGFIGPGDIANGSECRLPPPEDVGDVPCYNGGVDAPANGGVRVPEKNECGNPFHVRIATSERWQLFLIPWDDLVQWPCPNRLEGGIDKTEISKFEIRLTQGMQYEIWLDNIALYRSRGN